MGKPGGSRGERPKSNGTERGGGNRFDLGESPLRPLRRDDDEGIGGGGGIGGAPMENSEGKNGDELDEEGGGPNGGRKSALGLRKRLRSSGRAKFGSWCGDGGISNDDGKSICKAKTRE